MTTRKKERLAQLAADGLVPLQLDVTRPPLPPLPDVHTIVFAVGFDRSAGQTIQETYVGGLQNLLAAAPRAVQRFIYISSTGVYGQTDRSWIDEQSPCYPTRDGGKACLDAENSLRRHVLADRAIVLRLAGLYGPGRVPRQAQLMSGQPLAVPAIGYLNLVHVDDAAGVVMAAERQAKPPCTYLVADGRPVPRRDYYEYLASLLGAPRPQFEPPPPDSPAAARARGDKRVSNAKLLRELPVRFAYPSYREGLAAIVGCAASSIEHSDRSV